MSAVVMAIEGSLIGVVVLCIICIIYLIGIKAI